MSMVFNRYICSVLLGFAGWLFYAPVTSAETINDPYITSATISSTSTTVGASGVTYTVGFVLNQAVSVDNNINILISSTTGCRTDWEACQPNLSSATFSGVAGTTATLDGRNITLRATTELIASSYTLTISNATNPTNAAALRAFVATSASDEAVLLGGDFNSNNWYVTASGNVVNIGTLVVSGTVTAGGVAVRDSWVQLHNANWTVSNGGNTDSKGFYAIFADSDAAGYWASGAYTLTANAAEGSGHINTSATLTYSGSPLVQDISLNEANTFFTGTVSYSDEESSTVSVQAGAPVTNANVCFYSNGGSYCDATDAQGQYTAAVAPSAGSYQAYVSSANWNELVDWRYQNEGDWYSVAAAGTETVNFEVDATTSLLSGTVAVPDDSVALDGSINLTNKDVNYWGSVTDGAYTLNLNPGTYTLSFSPDTWSNSALGRYSYTGTVTIVEGENTFNFTVDELTATVQVTVVNTAGELVEGIQVNMWSPEHWAGGQTASDGTKVLHGYAGEWYDVNVWDENYLATEPNQKIQLVANETLAVNFVVQQPNAWITATFVDNEDNVPDSLRGWFGCNTNDYRRHYGTDLRNGTVELGVVVDPDTGEFDGQCSAWFPDESDGAVSPQDVLVAEGGTAALEFTLQPLDATVRAVVKNFATGKKIDADPSIHVNLWNQSDDMGHYAQLDENPVDISVISGKSYSGGIWSDSQEYIPLWSMNSEAIRVASGETETLILSVLQRDGSLRVNAQDPNGDPVEYGWAWCGNWEEVDFALDTVAANTVINTGGEIRNGVAEVPLVAGHSYRCGVGAPPEFVERGWLSPTEQAVEYASKNTALQELTFKFKEADATLTGSINVGADVTGISAAADLDKVFCWAWSEGGSSWTEDSGEGYRLNVSTDQETWEAGCDGVAGEDWYFTEQPYEFSPKKGQNTYDFTIIKMAGWKLYEAVNETFDAAENKVILYGDGTKLTIPAGTLASSGNVTVRGTPETNVVRTNDNPAAIPIDWEALDENSNLIEIFPGGTITIEIPYSDEVLANLGIEESGLIGKYYDELSGTWMQPDNVTQDVEANIITIVTDHFTQYGVTYNGRVANTRKPNKPALTVKSSGQHNAKLVLRTKKTSPKATRFVVQVRKFGVSGKGNVDTTRFRNTKEKARLVRSIQKLKRNTNYEVHAKACNSAGCSDSSAWKNFKTE